MAWPSEVMHRVAIPDKWRVVGAEFVNEPEGYITLESPSVDVVIGQILDS